MTDTSRPTILYAEDEILLAELGVEALEEAGFAVVRCGAGAAALAVLHDRVEQLRAIVTDVDLGDEVDGWALAQRARELHPEMPVVYVSGGHANDWASKGVPGSVMVEKPYAAGQLVVAVSTVMLGADLNPGQGA